MPVTPATSPETARQLCTQHTKQASFRRVGRRCALEKTSDATGACAAYFAGTRSAMALIATASLAGFIQAVFGPAAIFAVEQKGG